MAELTFIGHSTLLLKVNGLNILTDPIFSNQPFPAFFFKRALQPGMKVSDLPKIDIILISHAHTDHYDKRSLKKLNKDATVFAPPGYAKRIRKIGFTNVQELNGREWESKKVRIKGKEIKLTAIKSNHPRNCNGYIIEGDKTFYFPGDTGYFKEIVKIGKKFDIDMLFLPLMRYVPIIRKFNPHINAPESMRMVKEINPKYAMPIHWGFFPQTDREKNKFVEMMKGSKYKDKLLLLDNGESIKL